MPPVAAIAAVLATARSADRAEIIERLGPVPAGVLERAQTAREELAAADRLVGGPADIGLVHEALLTEPSRRAGAHYTPPDVARRLVEVALDGSGVDPHRARVWDPACGGGVFLLAAADALTAAGADPVHLLTEQIHGTDVDPGAALVTAESLRRWGRDRGVDVEPSGVRIADSLLGDERPDGAGGADPPGASFDLVIGNPPFQGQLAGTNVRSGDLRSRLRERFGGLVGPYTDTAALFLVLALRHLVPGGRTALVQPLSVLANRDTAAVREHLEEHGRLVGLWVANERVFDAAIEVCAPIVERRAAGEPVTAPRPIRRFRGRSLDEIEPHTPITSPSPTPSAGPEPAPDTERETGSWSPLALPALGVPHVRYRHRGRLGDLATTAAGFRDEYYGLVPHVTEAPTGLVTRPDRPDWPDHLAPLLTVGLIDPGLDRWGERPVRFAGRRLERPVVDLRTLRAEGGRAATWTESILVPKVVVATQTRVGEAAVDTRGCFAVSTPAIVVTPSGAAAETLARLCAVICSPVGSTAALARTAGTGRTATTIRHTTASLLELPLPVDEAAWDEGARALLAGDRPRFVDSMAVAHALRDEDAERLATWWFEAAPPAAVAI